LHLSCPCLLRRQAKLLTSPSYPCPTDNVAAWRIQVVHTCVPWTPYLRTHGTNVCLCFAHHPMDHCFCSVHVPGPLCCKEMCPCAYTDYTTTKCMCSLPSVKMLRHDVPCIEHLSFGQRDIVQLVPFQLVDSCRGPLRISTLPIHKNRNPQMSAWSSCSCHATEFCG
jgi:hypothetical protein